MAPVFGAILLGVLAAGSASSSMAQEAETPGAVEPVLAEPASAEPASALAMQLADWVRTSGDNGKLPFIVIDKVTAEVLVFDAEGALIGVAPALLGLARGDDSVPGIGDRELAKIKPEERTTPAGRYLSKFGFAPGQKEKVFWVDYATAVSLHPVVTANRKEKRLERLASPSAEDNRITFGCINVAKAFYDDVFLKTFDRKAGVVYILPETEPLGDVFPALQIQVAAAAHERVELAEAAGNVDASQIAVAVAAQASADVAEPASAVDAGRAAAPDSAGDSLGDDAAVITFPEPGATKAP